MNIFEHLIPDSAILGVGPLMLEFTSNQTEYQLYGKRRYNFDLHLSAHTAKINSDWFLVNDNPDEKNRMKAWHDKYFSVRERIARLINELTDEHHVHLVEVEKLHADTRTTFESLMLDMTMACPVPDISPSIDLRTQRIINNLAELKALATK